MRRISIEALAALLTFALLGGCATSKDEVLPHGNHTMLDVWHQETGGGAIVGTGGVLAGRQLLDARQDLRRPLTEIDGPTAATGQVPYTRSAAREIQRQFRRLPNPDLVMYVFPHLAGSDPVPVPGYSTVFPLHQRVQYAMQGERVENY